MRLDGAFFNIYNIDMERVKVVEIKEDITSRNNAQAQSIRDELKRRGVFFLNVMSSPGSGKTTLIVSLINRLKKDFKIGVIEADIDSAVDAQTVSDVTGVKTVQIHTMGACHLTCQMAYESLEALGIDGLDFVILENIGNLVCPAEFDTGASANLVILSVPEGDDKPIKYPLMFEVADVVAVTKKDVLPAFDFSIDKAETNINMRNKNTPVFFVSAVSGEGVDELAEYLKSKAMKITEA